MCVCVFAILGVYLASETSAAAAIPRCPFSINICFCVWLNCCHIHLRFNHNFSRIMHGMACDADTESSRFISVFKQQHFMRLGFYFCSPSFTCSIYSAHIYFSRFCVYCCFCSAFILHCRIHVMAYGFCYCVYAYYALWVEQKFHTLSLLSLYMCTMKSKK